MFFQYFTKDTEKTKIKKFEDEQLNEKELNNFLSFQVNQVWACNSPLVLS